MRQHALVSLLSLSLTEKSNEAFIYGLFQWHIAYSSIKELEKLFIENDPELKFTVSLWDMLVAFLFDHHMQECMYQVLCFLNRPESSAGLFISLYRSENDAKKKKKYIERVILFLAEANLLRFGREIVVEDKEKLPYKPNGVDDESIKHTLLLANIQLKLLNNRKSDDDPVVDVMKSKNGEQAWITMFNNNDFQGCELIVDAYNLNENDLLSFSVKNVVDGGMEKIKAFLANCDVFTNINLMMKVTEKMCNDPKLIVEVPNILKSWPVDKTALINLYLQHGFINEAFEEAKQTKNEEQLILIGRYASSRGDFETAKKCLRILHK